MAFFVYNVYMENIKTDILIIGAGIGGLWLNNVLYNSGYNCILVEKCKLGHAQTIMSQGIIHGGTKYNLLGKVTKSSNVISKMPSVWKQHINQNNLIPNLKETKIISDKQYLFSNSSISSKITTFFASKLMQSKIQKIDKGMAEDDFLYQFKDNGVYQLSEFVIDVKSLIDNLNIKNNTIKYHVKKHDIELINTKISTIQINDKLIEPKMVLFAAGEGNKELINELESIDYNIPQMQTRPLHMLSISSPELPKIFAHCIGSSNVPKFTITTHQNKSARTWYIGGKIAESGIDLSKEEQIYKLKQEFGDLFPSLNLTKAEFNSYVINRAEVKTKINLIRPDDSYIYNKNNYVIIWPTKLALVPTLTDKIIPILIKNNIRPNFDEQQKVIAQITNYVKPKVADLIWNE